MWVWDLELMPVSLSRFGPVDGPTLTFCQWRAFFAIFAATLPALLLLPSKEDLHFNAAYDRMTPIHLRSLYVGLIALMVLVVGTSVASLVMGDVSYDDDQGANSSSSRPRYGMAVLLVSIWYRAYSLLSCSRRQRRKRLLHVMKM